MQVFLRSSPVINYRVARLEGVQVQLASHAIRIAGAAEALFAPHRKTGSHGFSISHGRVDWFANFEGPAAAAVENGHWHNFTGKWVDGLHCLRDAMNAHAGARR